MSINLKPSEGNLNLKVKDITEKDPSLWLVTQVKLVTKTKSENINDIKAENINENENQSSKDNVVLEILDNK